MKKRLLQYLARTDALLDAAPPYTIAEWESIRAEHLQQLAFFQHERLTHLLVTLSFGVMDLGVGLALYLSFSPICAVLFLGLLGLLIPYIFHYYTLENGVQKMYGQYDKICSLLARERHQKLPFPD